MISYELWSTGMARPLGAFPAPAERVDRMPVGPLIRRIIHRSKIGFPKGENLKAPAKTGRQG